jgi:hypothetical protein
MIQARGSGRENNINKKLLEEVTAYFHLMRHGPHRTRKIRWGEIHRQQSDLIILFTKVRRDTQRDKQATRSPQFCIPKK